MFQTSVFPWLAELNEAQSAIQCLAVKAVQKCEFIQIASCVPRGPRASALVSGSSWKPCEMQGGGEDRACSLAEPWLSSPAAPREHHGGQTWEGTQCTPVHRPSSYQTGVWVDSDGGHRDSHLKVFNYTPLICPQYFLIHHFSSINDIMKINTVNCSTKLSLTL